MNQKHWLKHAFAFAVGIVFGIAAILFLANRFFPFFPVGQDVDQSIAYSLSELTNATKTTLTKPLSLASFLHDFAAPQSLLTDQGVIQLTNAARAANATGTASGVPLEPLVENPTLDKVALGKAQDMFANQYFEHVSPVTGKGPADIDTAAGYAYVMVGENLAEGDFASNQDLLNAWMASPGHRANILDDRYTQIGVAVLKGVYQGNTVWMAVQEFGLPASACPPTASAALSAEISTDNTQLADDNSQLASMKAKLATLDPYSQAYADEAAQYNQLIATYNSLITPTQTLINQYNAEVSAYNACAQAD